MPTGKTVQGRSGGGSVVGFAPFAVAPAPLTDPSQLQSVQDGATAEWWDTTVQASLTDTGGGSVTRGDEVKFIDGQNNVSDVDFPGDISDSFLEWNDNNLRSSQTGGYFWSAPLATDPATESVAAFCSFSLSGTLGADTLELIWLQQTEGPWAGEHYRPRIRFDQATNGLRFELTDSSSDDYVSSAVNSGNMKTAGFTYNKDDGLYRLYIDGTKIHDFSPSGNVIGGNRANMSTGDREGVEQDSWKKLLVKGYVTESEASELESWLRADTRLDGFVQDASVSVGQLGTVTEQLTVNEVHGTQVSYSVDSEPSNGSVSLNGSEFTYDPNDNYRGSDSFVVKADDTYATDLATVSADVTWEKTLFFVYGSGSSIVKRSPDYSTTDWSTSVGSDDVLALCIDLSGNAIATTNTLNSAGELYKVDSAGSIATGFPVTISTRSFAVNANSQDVIGVGTNNSDLLLYNPDGSSRGSYSIGGNVTGVAVNPSGDFFIVDINGNIAATDDSGNELWLNNTSASGVRLEAVRVSYDADTLYAGDTNGLLIALNASDGTELWTRSVSSSIEGIEADSDNGAFVSDGGETVYKVEPDGSSQSSISSATGVALFVSSDEILWAAGGGDITFTDLIDRYASNGTANGSEVFAVEGGRKEQGGW